MYEKKGYKKSQIIKFEKIARYTYDILIARAILVHGNKYDLSLIDRDAKICARGSVKIRCNNCENIWDVTVQQFINKASGCHRCSGYIDLTYDKFIELAEAIHGKTVNYSLINPSDKISYTSKINLKCNRCNYIWETVVGNHINLQQGCASCNGNARWTLERFLKSAEEIHKKHYDHSQIKEEDINTANSKIDIKCNTCLKVWTTTVNLHINLKHGCPHCKLSHLEKFTEIILDKYNNIICDTDLLTGKLNFSSLLKIERQYKFDNDTRQFDFIIKHKYIDKPILIECDGEQHFEYVDHFFQSEEHFEYRKTIDLYKTYLAHKNNYYIIRIDYKCENIEEVLNKAFEKFKQETKYENKWAYLSDREMYSWIITAFNTGNYPIVNPLPWDKNKK
jgi:hypothetical protein